MTMCLRALGYTDLDEDAVNRVMGAQPMRGASWENALACAQHFGCRATLIVPATVSMLQAWTDAGTPVMIAWNPEGRDWSHASVVFDVRSDTVFVADPNIPNPEQTVREVTVDDFYKKWFEKWPDYLVRRPALAIEREITPDGRQVAASTRVASTQVTADGQRGLQTFLEYSGPDTKIWNVVDPYAETGPLGRILYSRKSKAYTAEIYVDGDEDRRRKIGAVTADDERLGLKRALMFFRSPSRVAGRFLAGVR